MGGMILILIFAALLAFPGFYIITHGLFPRGSKKKAAWISAILTVILLVLLTTLMLGTL